MSKRRWYLACAATAIAGLSGLAGLWVLVTRPATRELRRTEIPRVFHWITRHELPSTRHGLRALYFGGGQDPGIFVRFKTDADGIAYIRRTFGGEGVKSEALTAARVASMKAMKIDMFPLVALAEKKLEISIFDMESLHSGLMMVESGGPNRHLSYKIVIDDEGSEVYMLAGRL